MKEDLKYYKTKTIDERQNELTLDKEKRVQTLRHTLALAQIESEARVSEELIINKM